MVQLSFLEKDKILWFSSIFVQHICKEGRERSQSKA